MELPNIENLDEKIYFRVTTSEKEEVYKLAGKKASRWMRWGFEQALLKLRETNQARGAETTTEVLKEGSYDQQPAA